MLRRYSALNYRRTNCSAQCRMAASSATRNYIGSTERVLLNIIGESFAFYMTYKISRRRILGEDVVDFFKNRCGVDSERLAETRIFRYGNYYLDVRFFLNYVFVCVMLSVVSFALPASFPGPLLTRWLLLKIRK